MAEKPGNTTNKIIANSGFYRLLNSLKQRAKNAGKVIFKDRSRQATQKQYEDEFGPTNVEIIKKNMDAIKLKEMMKKK